MNPRRRGLLVALVGLPLAACGKGDDVPARFPPLELAALDGSGGAFPRGESLLVNYWATWCGPCRAEMASLERVARRLAPRVRVVGVTVDEDLHLAREWLRRERVTFANFADPGLRLTRAHLAVAALPETFLLAADGQILERMRGAREWDREETAAAILRRAN